MRARSILIASALSVCVLGVFACRHKNKGPKHGTSAYETTEDDGRNGQNQGGQGTGAQPEAGGTCEGACQHYLGCKGVNDALVHDDCVLKCTKANYTSATLANFAKTDCVTAVNIVEGTGKSAPKSNECQGCVWDGSSCIWMSSSNWGAGPYSGAYSACKASCCGR